MRSRRTLKKTIKKMGMLGEGFYGKTYRLNYRSKGYTFYDLVNEPNVNHIELYTTKSKEHISYTDKQDIHDFMTFLRNKKDILAKIYKNVFFMTGKTVSQVIKEELESNAIALKCYGKYAEKYLTVAPITGFRNLKIMGAKFTLNYVNTVYVTFSTECNNKYDMDADKFIIDILESLVILQRAGYQHNDIKLDNIVLCKDRYKLIDWGVAGYINNNSKIGYADAKIGDPITTNPMKWYLMDIPGFASKTIMKIRALSINYKYEESKIFQEIYTKINNEFEFVITAIPDKKKLFRMYKNTFDIFMVGITLIHAIYRYKLEKKKYMPLAEKLFSIINPIRDAKEALHIARTYIKNYKHN